VLAALAGCHAGADGRAKLREEARAILAAHCGACHASHLDTAMPGALVIYDLDEPEWAARMTDLQLTSAHVRLSQPIPPDGREGTISDAERATFRRYVDAELAARSRATGCPADEILEAVHAAAFRMEHDSMEAGRRALAEVATRIHGPLDATTRELFGRLAFAASGGGDPREITEEVRAALGNWSCLTEEMHRRFHMHLLGSTM
jgi:hypothetical protein